MSTDAESGYKVPHFADEELKTSEIHPGTLHEAGSQAINGMVHHLFSTADLAKIVDVQGQEVDSIRTSSTYKDNEVMLGGDC